jgi:predicted MPP superfamily phosphohydrolase
MKYLFFLAFLSSFTLFSQQIEIKGTVFEDTNGNSVQDKNEKGIPNVAISDQIKVEITDSNGNFVLITDYEFPYVFVSQPSGYVGTYYYPKASEVNFPLKKGKDQSHFKFIHASDTHADSLNLPRMVRFRQMADSIGADFIVISGDLIRDALRQTEETASAYYKLYVQEISKFKMPVYSALGNHEIFGIERDKSLVSEKHPLYGKKMYRHFLGPNYFSFNYGGIHFISIDDVDYQNLYYFGGVDSLQLKWLEKDLKPVLKTTPIITFNHIPFISPGFSLFDYENSIFYGPNLLTQNGKLFHRHIAYNFKDVLDIIGERPYPLALSGHYHEAQESHFIGTDTKFAQTAAITRPDSFKNDLEFEMHSGFTLYEVQDGKIISSSFVPLNLK